MCPERKNAAYSEENIECAIAGNLAEIEAGIRPAFIPRPKPKPYCPHPKYKGFLALYYHYCYLLGRIEKRQYPPRMTPHLRQEIMKSGMETEYAQYAEAKAVLDACGFSRQALTKEKADIYEQLAQLNKQIRAERQKIKLCREIADSAAVMQRDVAAQEKSLHEKETEHSFTSRR